MTPETVKLKGRFIGRNELERHLNGKKLTWKQAARAKCFDCMGGYADGAMDCHVPACPLYQFMPYRDSLPARPPKLNDSAT